MEQMFLKLSENVNLNAKTSRLTLDVRRDEKIFAV